MEFWRSASVKFLEFFLFRCVSLAFDGYLDCHLASLFYSLICIGGFGCVCFFVFVFEIVFGCVSKVYLAWKSIKLMVFLCFSMILMY